MSDIRKHVIKLCDSVLGNYYLGKGPEEELAQKIKESLALLPPEGETRLDAWDDPTYVLNRPKPVTSSEKAQDR